MSRREEWQRVLDAEVARWSGMPWEQLVTELHEVRAYQVEWESKQYQVEAQLLENTAAYVHVSVSVDDGSLLQSILAGGPAIDPFSPAPVARTKLGSVPRSSRSLR